MASNSNSNRNSLASTAPPRSRWPSSRRSNPSDDEDTVTTTAKQVGIPFSWEDLPGIPKKQLLLLHKRSSCHQLPLPPARPGKNGRRNHGGGGGDPFLAALLECSKADREEERRRGQGQGRVWRRGIMGIMSCSRASGEGVSDSIVFLPTRTSSTLPYNYNYHLFKNTSD